MFFNRNTMKSRKPKANSLRPQASSLNPRHRHRRGILLLISLSMLVLFMMVGTAFVVTARHASDSAKSLTRASAIQTSQEQQAKLLDEVVKQLLRDTNNQHSSLRFHSLLRDMYGEDGFKGVIRDAGTAIGPRPESVRWAASIDNGGTIYADDVTDDSVVDPNITRGQVLEFDVGEFDPTFNEWIVEDIYGNPVAANPSSTNYASGALSPLHNAYDGLVLTFVNGPAQGVSTRVLGYRPFAPDAGSNPDVVPPRLRVLAFTLADGSNLPTDPVLLQDALSGSQFVVNGRPFSGTGAGYNPQTTAGGLLNAQELINGTNRAVALLPNAPFFDQTQLDLGSGPGNFGPYYIAQFASLTPIQQQALVNGLGLVGRGGSDESYDAADFQNMALAFVQSNPSETPATPTDLGRVVVPSFHRPALLSYWNNILGMNDMVTTPELLRKAYLRPNWLDHPNFDGANPEYAASLSQFRIDTTVAANQQVMVDRMIYGPWDVDNDNDGVRDSVWVDVGLPVMPGPNGKLVKPMAAILCIDMDGRLNVNAHGTMELANHPNGLWGTTPPVGRRDLAAQAAAGPSSSTMPRGSGWGPAEISLQAVFDQATFQRILTGFAQTPGRYSGIDPMTNAIEIRPGSNGFDIIAQIEKFAWPRNARQRTAFGSPPDLHARYGTGVNNYGQSVYEGYNPTTDVDDGNWLNQETPYELELSSASTRGYSTTAEDAPFAIAEMERALRAFDVDASSLPSRLWELAGWSTGTTNLNLRNVITTDSYDPPAPNISVPPSMRALIAPGGRLPQSVAELFEVRVRGALGLDLFPIPLTDFNDVRKVRRIVDQLLSPELASGRRMNVNRSLGNGRDDDNNLVVDEPFEREGSLWQFSRVDMEPTMTRPGSPVEGYEYQDDGSPIAYGGEMETTNAAAGAVASVDPRQKQAREIYVLALLNATDPANFNPLTPDSAERALAVQLAQWAINTVDFRDSDSIMSPFEFDLNPFDGWDVDGWVGGVGPDGMGGTGDDAASGDDTAVHRGLVWGAEKPELVLTETLAWHNRRTHDSAQEDPYPPTDKANVISATNNPDTDYDQVQRPSGALFVEIYNPSEPNPAASGDTHLINAGRDMGVYLGAVDPIARNPVWRMPIYKRYDVKSKNGVDPEVAALWDPDDPDPAKRPEWDPDRTVYFTTRDPERVQQTTGRAWDQDGTAYFTPTPEPAVVRPGRYIVVGPAETNTGTVEMPIAEEKGSRKLAAQGQRPSKRSFEMNTDKSAPHRVRMLDADDNPVMDPTDNTPLQAPSETLSQLATDIPVPGAGANGCVTDVLVINQAVDNSSGNTETRPLSLSEPEGGYTDKFRGAVWNGQVGARGQYVDNNGLPLAIDIPLDGPLGGNMPDLKGQPVPFYLDDVDPALALVGELHVTQPDPRVSYAFIYLQRLANPLQPWNPEPGHPAHEPGIAVNPYRTVDQMSSNLSVYNSAEQMEEDGMTPANACRGTFASVQRGVTNALQLAANATPSLLAQEPPADMRRANPRPGSGLGATPPNRLRRASLANNSEFWFNAVPDNTLGYLNQPFQDAANTGEIKQVKPIAPFEWLTWNNRPYVSSNELLLVPSVRSSQLLKQFSTAVPTGGAPLAMNWPYDVASRDGKGLPNSPNKDGFAHLANFFYDEGDPTKAKDGVPNGLHRVLEYLQTPSLYSGTETWLNPRAFVPTAARPINNNDDPRISLTPPFNAISEFRDPGRINLNTIADSEVWNGIEHDYTGANKHLNPSWSNGVSDSRRGYGAANAEVLLLDMNMPTFFGNPFRSPNAGDLVPLTPMVRKDVDCGLLRSDEIAPTATPNGKPLFFEERLDPNDPRNTEKHAYFRYQPITRLDNLVTTRSNVYAVWVTIGFFEVEPFEPTLDAAHLAILQRYNGGATTVQQAQMDPLFQRVYPDGYMFAKESGRDTGDIRRLRGFYMIDRTISVGFEPGVDHNTADAIRLRRQIE